ncbi:MAG: hypothetical protein V4819_01425 [Verrucomicrobiota bacterium]
MRKLCAPLLGLLMAWVCHASEVVAWKVPLSHYAPDGLQTEGVIRCKAAPESSPFFKEGDELWDLKQVPPPKGSRKIINADWIVWNATSERLVLKTEWHGIWGLRELFSAERLPKQCRLTVEVFRVPVDGAALSAQSMRVASHSVVTKLAQEFDTSQSTEFENFHAKGTVVTYDGDELIGLALDLSCGLPNEPQLSVQSAFNLWSGRSLWVARDFDGKVGLDFKVTASIELTDGTPWEQLMLIQKGNDVLKVVPDRRDMEAVPVRDSGWMLISAWISPAGLFLTDGEQIEPQDPFAERDPTVERELPIFLPFPMLNAPDILKPWMSQPVVDLRKWDAVNFMDWKDASDFIGYDPLKERAYLYTKDFSKVSMFKQLFTCMCCHPSQVSFGLDGDGQTRLIGKSGQRLRLTRTNGEQKILRSLEIEPTVGENNKLVDLRLVYADDVVPQQATRLTTTVTLTTGKPLELISGATKDDTIRSLRLKAEVQSGFGD